MDQSVNVQLAIDKAHTTSQWTLDCRPGLNGLNQVMSLTVPLPLLRVFSASITSLPYIQKGISLIS